MVSQELEEDCEQRQQVGKDDAKPSLRFKLIGNPLNICFTAPDICRRQFTPADLRDIRCNELTLAHPDETHIDYR